MATVYRSAVGASGTAQSETITLVLPTSEKVSMPEKIKLMADYECYPLWWADKQAGDIDPTTLSLSQETINRLEKWADVYDGKLNWDDPASSGFSTKEAILSFEQEGISLWKQLQQELAPNYEVVYFSDRLRKVVNHPNELEVLR